MKEQRGNGEETEREQRGNRERTEREKKGTNEGIKDRAGTRGEGGGQWHTHTSASGMLSNSEFLT